jgi:hypothetical protein
MAETTYHLHPDGEEAISEAKRSIKRYHELGLISTESAKALFTETVARIIMQARVGSDDRRMITVVCPDCKREHRMLCDVIEYRCKCDSNRTRLAWAGQAASPEGGERVPLVITSLRDRDVDPRLVL